jgi:hypothetical protein
MKRVQMLQLSAYESAKKFLNPRLKGTWFASAWELENLSPEYVMKRLQALSGSKQYTSAGAIAA